jgi:hypothetical protein
MGEAADMDLARMEQGVSIYLNLTTGLFEEIENIVLMYSDPGKNFISLEQATKEQLISAIDKTYEKDHLIYMIECMNNI